MNATEPLSRLKIVEKELERYQHDVEEWKQLHDELERECWIWEELIAKANYVFERFLKLDSDAQYFTLTGKCEHNAAFQEEMTTLLHDWLDVSRYLILHAARIESDYGSADGADKLRESIKAAESMLTPDEEFFAHDRLVELRDKAFEEHRRGETRMLLEDGRQP